MIFLSAPTELYHIFFSIFCSHSIAITLIIVDWGENNWLHKLLINPREGEMA